MDGSVLVTGAQGFVGGHLLRELGNSALATHADVTDPDALARTLGDVQPVAVVHLAALSWVPESWRDPARVWAVNAVGTVNLLEAVRAECAQARVLVVSTGEVYGRAEVLPTPENSPVSPVSPYAASKAAAEVAALQVRETGLDVVVARPFQHEGPGRDEQFAVGSWTHQIARLEAAGGGELLVGNLDAERDLTDVRDVCRAYRLLLDPAVQGGVYNVASGRTVTMRRVVELLVELATVPVDVKPDPERLRPLDLPVLCGDATRLRAATGWRPEIELEQTLRDTLEVARRTVRAERTPTT
ncbi:MAG: GDP-mannose 4,6-dehydratase [Gaiellaceae bacterium]